MRDDFTAAYIECALWLGRDEAPDGTGEVEFYENYDPEDIHPDSMAQILSDCADFQQANAADLEGLYDTQDGYTEASAGHDFWLTRNGHGAGFWDRGLGEVGDRLAEAARVYGNVDLYIGDDRNLHLS